MSPIAVLRKYVNDADEPQRIWALLVLWFLVALGIAGIIAVNYLLVPLRYNEISLAIIFLGLVFVTIIVLWAEY